ncbi:MAG: hypothetical protein J7513_16055 [Solirubrobacteraceae bacterium]|nr:hypothetical protein [Solirubrobacteraceae bacterium]
MSEPTPTPSASSRRRLRVAAVLVLVFAAALLVAMLGGDDAANAPVATAPAALTPAPTTTTATTPVPEEAAPSSPQAPFVTQACQPAALAAGSELGIGIPRAARLIVGGAERAVLDGAVGCLREVTGRPPVLRTQVPIDATRRAAPGDDEVSQLAAFGALLREEGAPGILSIRAHDFTRCGRRGAPPARQVGELAPGAALAPCGYPTPELYARLLGELRAKVAELAPGADLQWTAWNEPDHPMFTLLDGLGSVGAARRAGQYWARAAEQLGADRVLAGEFSDRDAPTLVRLRRAFVAGAAQEPPAWAIHPYRDLTDAGTTPASSVDEQFAAAVAPAPVWLTEVTARLSGRGGIGGDPAAQLARGGWLRAELGRRPVRAILYLLTPPDAPRVAAGDTWDSAIADRQGRARPFVCGLAGLPAEGCAGDPATFGG